MNQLESLAKLIIKIVSSPVFWLVIILSIGFWVRLYRIENPVADWHSWRQADTAAVARNFYQEGYNPFLPRGDDMSAISETGHANIQRLRMVEFPIYNSLIYFGYLLNHGVDERIARLVSIVFSLGSIIFVYFITRRYFDKLTAVLAAGIFAFLPYNIYFSRVILPEPSLVFFCLGMFYFTDRWINESGLKLFWISSIFGALAFLTKPMAIFYLLPLGYSFWQKEGRLWPIPKRYFLWLIPAFLPFTLWRWWVNQYPDGIPMNNWLYNGNGIRFRPSFWKWILMDRFGREILTITGSFLFFLGLVIRPLFKEKVLLQWLTGAMILYLIVFATGNVQHDYYQTLIIPALSMMMARGTVLLLRGLPFFIPRFWSIPMAILFLTLTPYFGWLEVKGLFQVNNGVIVDAGKKADQILPKNAVVVAPYQGDSAFLYQINRPGFPLEIASIADMKKNYQVSAYVSVVKDAKTAWLTRRYVVLAQEPGFVILDLTRDNPNFLSTVKDKSDLVEPY